MDASQPFECQYCPKTFQSNWNQVRHERTHNKPFCSREFNKSFASKTAKELHESSRKSCDGEYKVKETKQPVLDNKDLSSKISPEFLTALARSLTEEEIGQRQLQPFVESSANNMKECGPKVGDRKQTKPSECAVSANDRSDISRQNIFN